MERTHQVSRHHTRLIISGQMPMFLLRRVRSRLALSVGFGMSAVRSASGGKSENNCSPAVGAAADCGCDRSIGLALPTANHQLSRRCSPASRVSWIPSAAAVRAGDDFKQVTVRVFEVDTASVVVVIDLT